jgi:hypothetical protein
MILINWKQVFNNKQVFYFKSDKDAQYHMHFQITTVAAEKDKLAHLVDISTLLSHF